MLLALLLATACAGPGSAGTAPLADQNYPGTLQEPNTWPVQAVWQQRVTATWQAPGSAAEERGFDAALQRQGNALTVIGLSPMGSVGFSIQQGLEGLTVLNHMPEQIVIPPRFILLDVQRTFYPWLHGDTSSDDEPRGGQRDGERIREVWRDGKLQKRTFERLDQAPPGRITITYTWGNPDWAVPTHAVLDNGWFGYQLDIVTHSETRIEEPPQEPQEPR